MPGNIPSESALTTLDLVLFCLEIVRELPLSKSVIISVEKKRKCLVLGHKEGL